MSTTLCSFCFRLFLMYTDDHRYTGVKALGGQEIETPHMDAMVSN